MKLNLAENFARLENSVAARLLQNIEDHLPISAEHAYVASLGPDQLSRDTTQLNKGFFWSADESLSENFVIECLTGSLWVTRGNGLRDDIILIPGRSYVSRPGDHILVEALEDSTLRATKPGVR